PTAGPRPSPRHSARVASALRQRDVSVTSALRQPPSEPAVPLSFCRKPPQLLRNYNLVQSFYRKPLTYFNIYIFVQ
ncbi:MAG TPA: hypothetical protein VFK94_02485, partial [Patescibacteria group bacterium]|nr:hypothetical protein [Patescibacteria group bacterium]